MSYKFYPLKDTEKKTFADMYAEKLPRGYQDLSLYKMLQAKPSFYPGWMYVTIQKEEDVTAKPITVFTKQDEIVMMDWQAATLLSFNQTAPLVLSVDNITDYLVFFFAHVRGQEGGMQIISSYDDFKWREEPVPQVKKTLSGLIRAPYLMSWDEQNRAYELGAHILFRNNLFECRIKINREGDIDVSERTLQVEDMPLLDISVE